MKKTGSLQPLVNHYEHSRPMAWEELFARQAPIFLEIGFGMGERLVQVAAENPSLNVIGIEQHWERIYKTLRRIDTYNSLHPSCPVGNIKILRCDVRVALQWFFAEQSIGEILCLFPCPWPKKSHARHRLFSRCFFDLMNSRMKAGAKARLVTDDYDYFEWVQGQLPPELFDYSAQNIHPQFGTKFERKWLQEGKGTFFELFLTKKNHRTTAISKDSPMKSYRITEFNPDNFHMQDLHGDITVSLKDYLYDARRARAQIYVLVVEGHLTQHLRVNIVKKEGRWSIARAEGQVFLPTPGIVKAIEAVYQAAKASC